MRSADARSPHEALFAMSGGNLAVVRSGKWKLHCRAPQAEPRAGRDASKWVDPRGPDGVTLLAPYEQARPDQYPGVQTGDPPKPFMLFDLQSDPSEQHDVAAQNPQVVARLKALFEKLDAQIPRVAPPPKPAGGLRRVKGGELRYDRIPNPPAP
jgi:hypothetical protein